MHAGVCISDCLAFYAYTLKLLHQHNFNSINLFKTYSQESLNQLEYDIQSHINLGVHLENVPNSSPMVDYVLKNMKNNINIELMMTTNSPVTTIDKIYEDYDIDKFFKNRLNIAQIFTPDDNQTIFPILNHIKEHKIITINKTDFTSYNHGSIYSGCVGVAP